MGTIIRPDMPQSTLPCPLAPYSPRFAAQEAAIMTFIHATNKVLFDSAAAPSPQGPGPGEQTATCVDETAGSRPRKSARI
jgi:hypothetical protein